MTAWLRAALMQERRRYGHFAIIRYVTAPKDGLGCRWYTDTISRILLPSRSVSPALSQPAPSVFYVPAYQVLVSALYETSSDGSRECCISQNFRSHADGTLEGTHRVSLISICTTSRTGRVVVGSDNEPAAGKCP